MTEYFVGTGGWSYFKIPTKPSLKAYSENFNYVEVNSTFYKYPPLRTVERWRRIVPSDFVFTVRCHHELTHTIGLKPVDEAHIALSRMIGFCRILEAPFLHLLTPASYSFDRSNLEEARNLFSSINLKGVRLAWEVRGPTTLELTALMQDLNILDSVDVSREKPSWESDALYTRVFGKGKRNIYQFTDEELVEIDHRIMTAQTKTAIVAYHGTRMSTDALRFKKYKETGKFLPVTAFTGVESVKAVLLEDATFPSTKADLLEGQGWKVVDFAANKRIHLSNLLEEMPEKTYSNINEVIKELEFPQ
ncbi:MAG: DUF72 domain-containing protein [Candidatus Bathyarchaeota archaeon]|nr:DUF72 domain-containing protein [Candidatus Bathyarchaeota archaeon]